ncbi:MULTISPECIES: hypothetical protein [unclassified Brevibacillus]|uniref:hypothetical protein n=1 Tax=unclassified Brevibacillus TaxID=2684853 RepID=UPI0035633B5D
MSFADLDQKQIENLLFFLDKADQHELNKFKYKYAVKPGRNTMSFRENTLNNVMTGCIPFNEFMDWLSHIYLEGNNMLFVYEPKDINVFDHKSIDEVYSIALKAKEHLYNINVDNLDEIKLVNVWRDTPNQQLIFTFASPAQVMVKEKDPETGMSALVNKSDIYLSYFVMDYSLKHFVLMMHPTENLVSILGEQKKKEWDDLIWILLRAFRLSVINFEINKPEWIFETLHAMTEEYFHHNNPVITEKINEFQEKLIRDITDQLVNSDTAFSKKTGHAARFSKSLLRTYENELIVAYGPVQKELDFEIFLHKSDKGTTEFKANSRGKAFVFAECADILRLMKENGEIAALGINYKLDDNGYKRAFPYLISIRDRYYSLRRTTTATTVKEVVDGVIRKLNNYKQEVQPSFTGIAENE